MQCYLLELHLPIDYQPLRLDNRSSIEVKGSSIHSLAY